MGRSIKLIYETYDSKSKRWVKGEDVEVPSGINIAEVNLPCERVVKYITVEIDGQKNNKTFNIETYNQWFDYSIERSEVIGSEYVKIKLIIPKNLDTAYRYGGLIIHHNSSPLTAYIELSQEPTVYSLEVTYDKNDETKGIFRSIPWMDENGNIIGDGSSVYQEKRVDVTAHGGSQEWYLKDIEQYEAYSNLKDEAKTDRPIKKTDIEDDIRVPYDGALSYYLKNKCSKCGELFTEDICPNCNCSDFVSVDKSGFYVKSYGKIDMSGRHMRYFFRICHKDVDNRNKKYLDSDNNPYEVMKLFIFDKGVGQGYEEGDQT